MNNLNNSVDEPVECPLCMEPLEVDDLNFFPCTCGYQICRFCWHRIRTDENELCPACRKEYPENPADFKPLTQEEMIAFKSQKRQRDQQRKQKITENRKHLANVRVVQKNLVFVVGLPPRLADADTLRKHEYFGKYGKIHKVVINPSTTYAGVQGPSASAYVTYIHNTDALRAIQSVNNIMIDGRLIKTSLGTTKYCSHFMKNQQCPKADCMYLHELGDPEASFTKEEMHQGKHQEYEKRLHDVLIASSTGCGVFTGSTSTLNGSGKNSEFKMTSDFKMTATNSSTVPVTSASVSLCLTTNNSSSTTIAPTPQKETWPSLSISPVNQKDSTSNNCNKNRKERVKQEKSKIDKISKPKNIRSNNTNTLNPLPKEIDLPVVIDSFSTNSDCLSEQTPKSKCDKSKERNQHSLVNRTNPKKELVSTAPAENEIKGFDKNMETITSTSINLSKNGEYLSNRIRNDNTKKIDRLRSLSSSSNSPLINENESGKSSSCSFNEENAHDECIKDPVKCKLALTPSSELDKIQSNNLEENFSNSFGYVSSLFDQSKNAAPKGNINNNINKNVYFKEPTDNNRYEKSSYNDLLQKETEGEGYTTESMAKLNLLDENSFFSSPSEAIHSSIPLHRKHNDEIVPNQLSSGTAPNLPDLINGIEGYQNSTNDFQSNSNSYLTSFDLSRQSTYLQYQQQPSEPSKDNIMQNSLFGTNMSKFFDFHKHQQQKLQNCLKINGQNNINGTVNESLHMMPTIESNRLNSKMIDQNCDLISQQQKQKPFAKTDRLLCHQTFQQIPNPQMASIQSHQNQYMHNSACDDDLGFDPFMETQKALAELIENEEEQNLRPASPKLINQKQINNVNQPHMIDYIQRSRLPPPGFNHVNSFTGYGVVPRVQDNKVVSFMNLSTNYAAPSTQHIQQQQQLQVSSNAWGAHLGNFQQYINEQQVRQMNSNQMSGAVNQKGYTGNDWTAMDPAILSLRQFSFPHQTSQVHPQQQDIFLQQLTHQQQQPGFTSQSQHLSGGSAGIPNTIINSQQNSQTQVNANVQGMLEYLKTRQFV